MKSNEVINVTKALRNLHNGAVLPVSTKHGMSIELNEPEIVDADGVDMECSLSQLENGAEDEANKCLAPLGFKLEQTGSGDNSSALFAVVAL